MTPPEVRVPWNELALDPRRIRATASSHALARARQVAGDGEILAEPCDRLKRSR
jgi:hypothetical protein